MGRPQPRARKSTLMASRAPWVGANSLTGSLLNNITPLIGSRNNAAIRWKGSLDDVRIYTRALSAQEVSDLYTGGSGGQPDVTPPLLSGGAPAGALPAGTTQTTLSVSTDE